VPLFKGTVTLQQPADWSLVKGSLSYQLIHATSAQLKTLSATDRESLSKINVDQLKMSDHAAAITRLSQVAAESTAPVQFSLIAGWPALERSQLIAKPRSGPEAERAEAEDSEQLRHVTIAIAAGNLLVRLDGFAVPSDSAAITQAVEQMGRGLQFQVSGDQSRVNQELQQLRQTPPPRTAAPAPSENAARSAHQSAPTTTELRVPASSALSAGAAFTNLEITTEPEVAVSTDGQNIVVAAQCGFSNSQDGGKTFPFGGTMPHCNGGDSSMAFGRSGNFYEATIGFSTGCPTGICATAINQSTNKGQTFTFLTNAFDCTAGDPCGFGGVPDQEHLVADRFNAATGGDQVYVAIREGLGYDLACSVNSGASWTIKTGNVNHGSTDFPRVTVGQDGFLYVATVNGSNVEIDKYSSCSNGLTLQFNKVVASGISFVTCPVPGLDRCNNGNNLSSITAAVDDTNAKHVYVSYAVNTASGSNENIIVQDSIDGGSTWSRPPVQVNNGIVGRRYMPWICATGGAAYVSWYDRRASIPCPSPPCASNNDLADYYAASASLDGLGNLAPGAEFQINSPGTSDPECAGGATPGSAQSWGCGTRAKTDASACSFQPQLAGRCFKTGTTCGNPGGVGSGQPCDLNTGLPACPSGETCSLGSGNPKYGDYNGNTCSAGRVYTVWGSGTSQPGATPASGINLFFAQKLVCCDPQIQVPSPLTLSACTGKEASTTANVCNTGKADLQVNSITFNEPEFFVSNPSSGFPVTVSPDSCFPFQVNFFASGSTTVTGTMTITSNDSVNPSAAVPIVGQISTPSIATALANSGNFGGVCIGSVGDLPLTINNTGQCSLSVNNILTSDPEFSTANVINYPLAVAAGASTTLQLQFKPTLPTGTRNATTDVVSNDPINPNFVIPMTGISEAPLVTVTGTSNFGKVCAGVVKDETFKVCNLPVAGTCQLNVTNVALNPGCKDFTIVSNPFPEYLGAEQCGNVTVQFTPTSDGTKTCNLIVTSSDPATPTDVVPLTGTTPIPSISISPALAFPPTVEGNGKCAVTQPFPVTNTGICPLTINGVTLGPANPEDYGLVDLPNQTNVLPPGGSLSDGGFAVRFEPVELNRNVDSSVDVTYISDPILGTKKTVDRNLCGEGVYVGARVLVTLGGVPVSAVDRIQLIQVSTGTVVDSISNAALHTVTPRIAACAPFQFHREYGTVSNTKGLVPGSYQVKVTLTIAGKQQTKTVTFTDNSCGFAHPIVVAF